MRLSYGLYLNSNKNRTCTQVYKCIAAYLHVIHCTLLNALRLCLANATRQDPFMPLSPVSITANHHLDVNKTISFDLCRVASRYSWKLIRGSGYNAYRERERAYKRRERYTRASVQRERACACVRVSERRKVRAVDRKREWAYAKTAHVKNQITTMKRCARE